MRRRDYITLLGGAAAWPLAARAQQQAMAIVGVLSVGSPATDYLGALRRGLAERGYIEGRNLVFEYRSSEQYEALPALATSMVARGVAAIFTISNLNAALAAKAATTSIPIIFTIGADPVTTGLVASLNRSGGNVTGVNYQASEMEPKRLELLRELIPKGATIVYLVNPTNTGTQARVQMIEAAARNVGQRIIVLNASTTAQIDSAFETIVAERAGGLLLAGEAFFASRRDQFIVRAAIHRVPAVYFAPEFTLNGGLMSYSDDRLESLRQAGVYVGRVLKGEKPADLPVVQPTKFDLVINLTTAKAIGLTVPPTLLAIADEVIE
jgi:putative ABC transport system substrate-binding protein